MWRLLHHIGLAFYAALDFLREKKNKKEIHQSLSSLRPGECFVLPDDEYNLWVVYYFGWQGVYVGVFGKHQTEWFRYDQKVKKQPFIRVIP